MKYVVLTLCACLALVGCGSDPVAQPDPSPSTSSAVATPTTKGPETPQEFLRRWYRVADQMERDGVTGPFEALNLDSCRDCATYEDTVRGIYRRGERVLGTHTRVDRVTSAGVFWRVDVWANPTRIVDSKGRVKARLAGGGETYRFALKRRDGEWRVAGKIRLGKPE